MPMRSGVHRTQTATKTQHRTWAGRLTCICLWSQASDMGGSAVVVVWSGDG